MYLGQYAGTYFGSYFGGVEAQEQRFGGALKWYADKYKPKEHKKEIDYLIDSYVSFVKELSPSISEFEEIKKDKSQIQQKKQVAFNLLKQVGAHKSITDKQIEMAIKEAEIAYLRHMATIHESEEEAVVLLLLN